MMMTYSLKSYNQELFDSYLKLDNIKDLSSPLLVSSKRFLGNIKKNPIMYIGQETNGWVNYDKDNVSLDDIENSYDDFLIDYKTSKTAFWQFIKDIVGSYDEIASNVVWTNTLVVGNRYSKGSPEFNNKIKNLSLNYLLFLYEYFEPSIIINVSGNTSPYYKVTRDFLSIISSNIKDIYPNKNESMVIDTDKSIIWTYHPMRLRLDNNFDENINKIRKLI